MSLPRPAVLAAAATALALGVALAYDAGPLPPRPDPSAATEPPQFEAGDVHFALQLCDLADPALDVCVRLREGPPYTPQRIDDVLGTLD